MRILKGCLSRVKLERNPVGPCKLRRECIFSSFDPLAQLCQFTVERIYGVRVTRAPLAKSQYLMLKAMHV
jgi:hypothetical protein